MTDEPTTQATTPNVDEISAIVTKADLQIKEAKAKIREAEAAKKAAYALLTFKKKYK